MIENASPLPPPTPGLGSLVVLTRPVREGDLPIVPAGAIGMVAEQLPGGRLWVSFDHEECNATVRPEDIDPEAGKRVTAVHEATVLIHNGLRRHENVREALGLLADAMDGAGCGAHAGRVLRDGGDGHGLGFVLEEVAFRSSDPAVIRALDRLVEVVFLAR